MAFQSADLCDSEALRALCAGQDAVVHCAALSAPWGPLAAFQRANVLATERLVAAATSAGVRRLVHISTPSIYMGQGSRIGAREDDPLPPPINHYAATKLAAEASVLRAHAAGLPSIVLRPRALFGPGDTTIFPRLLRALSTGRMPIVGSGDNRVDLTFIDNAVSAVVCALEASASALGQAYNISNGEPVRLWEFLRALALDLGYPPPRFHVSRQLALRLSGVAEAVYGAFPRLGEPLLTRYTVSVLADSMTLDIHKAEAQLGYRPAVSIEEGKARFVASLKGAICAPGVCA
jgi:nucleoside-diphosphate-sugar epimerase